MFRRILSALALVGVAVMLLLVAWPQLVGIHRAPGVAQLSSLRGMLLGVGLLCGVLVTLVALITPRIRRFAAALALLLFAFCGVQFAVLATRGAVGAGFESKAPGDLTVLAWNTLGDAVSVQTIAEAVIAQDADIVALPETSRTHGDELAAALAVAGIGMQVLHLSYDEISTARTTVLLVSTDLGDYTVDTSRGGTDTLPSLLAVPADGTGPVIIAAHPVAPIPGEMEHWRQGLEWLTARCAAPNVILAGDLNSTLDHFPGLDPGSDASGGIGGCRDAARSWGSAAVGTWPALLPPLLGAPIDHVMATPNWSVTGFRVIADQDGAGSDHRPLVAQLRPAD